MRLLAFFLFFLCYPADAEVLDPIFVSDVDKASEPSVSAPGSEAGRDYFSIKKRAPRSLKDAFGDEPNLNFVGGPRGDAELPQIRGLSSARILVLDEGVRQNFQSGHNGRVFSGFSLMEQVEVVKGPWSSLYGSGAMGGVISLRRSTAADFVRRTGKKQGAEVSLEGGSNAKQFGQRATGFASMGRFEALASYYHSDGGDLRLGNGARLPYSETENQDLYAAIASDLGSGHSFELKVNRFEDKGREPLNPESGDTAANLLGDAKSTKQDVVGTYRWAKGRHDVHAKPYYRETKVTKSRVSDGRNDVQTVGTYGIDTWANFRRALTEKVDGTFTLGTEYFHDRNIGRRNGGALASFPDGTTSQWGLYFQPELRLSRWKITPGLRYDSFRSRSGLGADSKGHQTSKKLYLTHEFSRDNEVFAGWGEAFNAPRLQDLYVSGLHFPGGGPVPNNFFIPNPDLRPERAHTYEAGFKVKRAAWSEAEWNASGTYFHTEAKDFIQRDVNVAAGTTRFANLQRVRLKGFELGTGLQISKASVRFAYGHVRSRDKSNGAPLSDTPADQWTAQVDHEVWGAILGTELRLTERQDRVPSGTAPTGSYFVQDLYAMVPGSRWNLVVRVNNLYDRAYRRHGSTNLEEGRDVQAVTSWLF